MTKENKFIPEVGQVCKHKITMSVYGLVSIFEVNVEVIDKGEMYAWVKDLYPQNSKPYPALITALSPTPSKADKEREEQIKLLKKAIFSTSIDTEFLDVGLVCLDLYNDNVRVLKEGEEIGRRLSDEQIESLIYDFGIAPMDIQHVQATIFGAES